jgi:SAM-dependent methyltransferase
MNPQETRQLVREKYGEIARTNSSCCCGKRTAASTYAKVGESYEKMEGYVPEADLGLGCGIPTEHAGLAEGQTVLDLGAGAGNDVFVARRVVGDTGKVIGVDFSEDMLEKARANQAKLGYENVEFHQGEIEDLPLPENTVDVVISNCVLNLVPDKTSAFREIYRVLRPGGHFCVSDIVLDGQLPEKLRTAAEYYVGCVAGALQKSEYLGIIEAAGFEQITVATQREVVIPDEDLLVNLNQDELRAFRASGTKILSVTVKAGKPEKAE